MTKRQRVPVSRRALVQRLRRKLAGRAELLYTTRGREATRAVGDFYIVDSRNCLVGRFADIRELWEFGLAEGVVSEWETLADE
jgi:hypothetical protein